MRRWVIALALTGAASAAQGDEPTFHRDVERILQQHCQDCHRPGQIAPFSLLTYEHARKRASDLVRVVETGSMPPWAPSTREGGPFRGARALSPEEVATLRVWANTRAPRGRPKDAPAPKRWSEAWPLGQPDVVLSMAEPYRLSGDGDDEVRVFVIPTDLAGSRWISAIDFHPGNPRVVHHARVAFDTKKIARVLDRADSRPGYAAFGGFGVQPSETLGDWSPGKRPLRAPEGTAYYLPAGADLLLQVHYRKTGKLEADTSVIGLYFAKTVVDKALHVTTITPPRAGLADLPELRIPPGDANHEVTGRLELERGMHLVSVAPHMHLRGKDFLVRASQPDGAKRTLIKVERWDHNWQGTYAFATPVALPKGTIVEMVAHFDNSANNPSNPRKPPVGVRWGERSYDEMCLAVLSVTYDDEQRTSRDAVDAGRP